MSNIVLDGMIGLVVGDALGVPVEFNSRKALTENPVEGMRSYGTYNQPAGTWSDDSSMTLATVNSLVDGLDYDDIMNKFTEWLEEAAYTPHGEVFDVGIGTRKSLRRYADGIPALEAGGTGEYDNGNGSLMRILPMLYYLEAKYGRDFTDNKKAFDLIHKLSALTHGHKRSQMACGIYLSIASQLINGGNLKKAVYSGIHKAMDYYQNQEVFHSELSYFNPLADKEFKNLPVEEIKSSGYVIDTLEAAIWCLLNTRDYKSSLLKAVNLGEDTDTVAAVTGGLAGIKYGIKAIPNEWKAKIIKREYVEDLSNNFYQSLTEKTE